MKIYRNLLTFFGKKSQKPSGLVYDSIETLPLWNWQQVHDTGNYKYLHKELKEIKGLEAVWAKIYNEYYATFGMSDKYREFLMEVKQIVMYKCDSVITGDRTKEVFARSIENDHKELFERNQKTNIDETLAAIEEYQGYQLDSKILSVKKYFIYLNRINKKGWGKG